MPLLSHRMGETELDPQLAQLIAKHFTLHVGADVCAASFVVAVKNAASQILETGSFENHNDGYQQFLARLSHLNPSGVYQIKVAIECTGPYHLALVRFLQEHGVEVYLYNGQTAKHLAKAHLKEKKTDSVDAEILANLLIDGKFPTSATPEDNPFIELRSYSRRSGRLAEQAACAKTQLKDELAQASPGMLHVFRKQSIFNKAPMHLMRLYPLPADRLAAGVEAVGQVLASQSGNKYGRAEAESLLAFDAQNPSDERLNGYFRRSIRDYIDQIQYLITQREQYLTEIQAMTKDCEPAQHLMSIKGVGTILMAIVLSEIGDIERFADPKKFVGYAGLAPVEHESGPYKGEKHLKKGGCPRLSYACYMIGNCTRRYDPRLGSLYHRVKGRHIAVGKPNGIAHIIANCAVAREIALLIYHILTENRPYFLDKADYDAYKAKKSAA